MSIKRFHTPKGLTEWLRAYLDANIMESDCPDNYMTERVRFLRDDIGRLFFEPSEILDSDRFIQMVGLFEHDGIELPIVRLNFGVFRIQLSGTRNGWTVSCYLPVKMTEDFGDLFNPDRQAETHQFSSSGFDDDEIYGPYSEDPQKFTVVLGADRYKLYYFMRRISEHLKDQEKSREASAA